jgi:hypothetical protein
MPKNDHPCLHLTGARGLTKSRSTPRRKGLNRSLDGRYRHTLSD